MPILANELARRDNGRIEIRPTPMRLHWTLDDITAADGHSLRMMLGWSARGLDDRNNRIMLEEVFFTQSPSLTTDSLAAYIAPVLRAAAIKSAAAHNATDLLGDNGDAAVKELTSALRAAANARGFTCGVEFLPPFELELDSPSLRREKIESLQRSLHERRVAGQVEQWEKASHLFCSKFRSIRKSASELSSSAVLEQVAPSDRGSILQTLLQAAGRERQTRHIWVAAGPQLVKIDCPAFSAEPGSAAVIQTISLPATLGPLRSVQSARMNSEQDTLLVGARNGVIAVGSDAASPRLYADAGVASQLGFSSALFWAGSLWACHGEAGIVKWNMDAGDEPSLKLRPSQLASSLGLPATGTPPTPRHSTPLDDARLMFSAGTCVALLSADGSAAVLPTQREVEILSIVPQEQRVLILYEDGTIVARDRQTLEVASIQNRGGRLVAAGALPWLGDTRLLLVGGEGPIQCIGFDDSLVTEYAGPYRGPRLIAGAADVVAAVSADRQRLVLWNSWDGRRPLLDLSIAAIARHRIADVDFG